MNHGGRRPGAGRKPGSIGKRTKQLQDAVRQAREARRVLGPDAFDGDAHALLTLVYRDTSLPLDVRIHAATVAISYESPRLAVIDSTVRTETAAPQLTEAERRERARQAILEAFAERPEPQMVIAAGKPTLRVIEHQPAADEAKSEEPADRSG